MALSLSAVCLGQSRSPDDASTEDNVYTNFFFRFHYSFSASWVPQPADVAEQLQKAGQSRLDDGKQTDAAKVEKHYYLLTLFRNLPGQGVNGRSRAIISLVADDVSAHPEATTGRECVLKLAEHLKKAHYAPVGEPQEVQIGGLTFFRQDLKGTSSAGAPVYQSAIFTVSKGYALGFMLISPSQSMLSNMAGTLDKVQFY